MDYKTGKLHKIIRQFDKGNGTYEINGIDRQKAVFLYRKKAEAFIPIPKGNYRINTISDSTQELEIDNIINDVAVEFQIIYQFEIMSSKYEEQFPELDIVVMKLNQIVDDINNIVDYSNSVGIKSDSKFQTQILTPLEPLSVWYMNEEGLIDTMPIDSFNKKFTEIMSKMEELANEKANEKVEHHLNRLQQRITELKTEIEHKKNTSKKELESKMPEINRKFNGIAGGLLNFNFIQDSITKMKAQYYLDRNTGKLYQCIQTTSSKTNSVTYFKDVSLNGIVERLENLFSYQKLQNWFSFDGNASAEIFKVSTLKIMKITIETTQNNTSLKVIFPEIFLENPFITVVDNETNGNSTAYTRVAVDWVQKDSVLLKGLDRGFTMLVIGKG